MFAKEVIKAALGASFQAYGSGNIRLLDGYERVNLSSFKIDKSYIVNGDTFRTKILGADGDDRGYAVLYKKTGAAEYILAFRGTDDIFSDIAQYKDILKEQFTGKLDKGLGAYIPLLNAINAKLSGADLTLTGHSLGGWLANHALDLEKKYLGNFDEVGAVGFESPYLSRSPSAVNFGFENDAIYGSVRGVPNKPTVSTASFFFAPNQDVFGLNPIFAHALEHSEYSFSRIEQTPFGGEISQNDFTVIMQSDASDPFETFNFPVSRFGMSKFYKKADVANILGGDASEGLNGGSKNDRIAGLGGDDILKGFAGNDTLAGGAGRDTLDGGEGSDVYYLFDSADTVIESADAPEIRLMSAWDEGTRMDCFSKASKESLYTIRCSGNS